MRAGFGPEHQLIRALVAETLSSTALALLRLFAAQSLTATAGVRLLVRQLPCAPSTGFAALARLRKLGIVENGVAEAVRLTPAGILLAQLLRDKEDRYAP